MSRIWIAFCLNCNIMNQTIIRDPFVIRGQINLINLIIMMNLNLDFIFYNFDRMSFKNISKFI